MLKTLAAHWVKITVLDYCSLPGSAAGWLTESLSLWPSSMAQQLWKLSVPQFTHLQNDRWYCCKD